VRNAQASVLAPTGTISFMMDADTTGIEPDLGLVKTKKLVGGGTMSIVNQTVSRALRQLGYGEVELAEIVASWSKRRAALIDEGLGDEAFDVVREELRSRGCGDPDRFIAGVQGRTKRTVNG
jgi:ribonucleoside-diphosphate reductase alpha chain